MEYEVLKEIVILLSRTGNGGDTEATMLLPCTEFDTVGIR